jgi:hypothetical protein
MEKSEEVAPRYYQRGSIDAGVKADALGIPELTVNE